MALLMNAADMDRMLEEIRPEGETYTGKAWGTIMGGAVEILALGALSNVYCYVGVTERSLVIAILETFDISHIYGKVCLPFDQIRELKIGHGLMPSQRIIKLKAEGVKLKLSLVNNTLTTRGIDQKSGMKTILAALEQVKK
ncbi:hypothetical protein INF30_04915 [Lachnospiraceae bacterium DSM 108991]|uniref:YokE-like PH domain-containing protein n=1 Tax=Claveliimonas monacensis TaxID=2779351 RepID=A0ABR9RI21_9FIRM|nr:hypothetical protein [Claveliimonas monacensis]MBE5062606.1 hypothetical protein [Claveliimonas monacensis]